MTDGKVRLGVSACLLGTEVRFDGGHKRDGFLQDVVGGFVDWVPVCPEFEMGLGIPREAMRLVGSPDAPRLVGSRTGNDHTAGMLRFLDRRLKELRGAALDGFVLKKGSPTCGLERVKVYDDNGVPSPTGRGLFTAALERDVGYLPMEEEGRLNDPRLRENFFERVFAQHRWRRLVASDPSPGDLVRFHADHKLILLSHGRHTGYALLGRLVARAGAANGGFRALLRDYEAAFFRALAEPATVGHHVDVLSHLMGFLKRALDGDRRAALRSAIDDYRAGHTPLAVPLTLVRHELLHADTPAWVRNQAYLDPYPKELMLRNGV